VKTEFTAFRNSLEALAQVGLRATGARSFAFNEGSASRSGGASAIVEYILQTAGATAASVAFTFGSDREAMRARPRLDRIAATMQAIWTAAATDRYADLVRRLADLEARLIDSKIADRVQGYLAVKLDSDPVEAIARHVDTVLRPTRTRVLLEQVASELEDEIEERRLVSQAKKILQAVHFVSEEQAHIELRLRSRQSRKPLKEVARQVIEHRLSVNGMGV
jgi:hypothetical protein